MPETPELCGTCAHEDGECRNCFVAAAELIKHLEAENGRLQMLRRAEMCDCNRYSPSLADHDEHCHWRETIEQEAEEIAAEAAKGKPCLG